MINSRTFKENTNQFMEILFKGVVFEPINCAYDICIARGFTPLSDLADILEVHSDKIIEYYSLIFDISVSEINILLKTHELLVKDENLTKVSDYCFFEERQYFAQEQCDLNLAKELKCVPEIVARNYLEVSKSTFKKLILNHKKIFFLPTILSDHRKYYSIEDLKVVKATIEEKHPDWITPQYCDYDLDEFIKQQTCS